MPPAQPKEAVTRPVSLRPLEDRHLRNAGRLLAMVHELHKAGYQRIRIMPGMAPSGVFWRCHVTYAANVADDLCSVRCRGDPGHIARYSSSQGAHYFDWPDGDKLTARQLAHRFLETYPVIAQKGAGRDWAYAGWLTDVLGHAEQGKFVRFYADYPIDPAELEHWAPPPPPPEPEDRG